MTLAEMADFVCGKVRQGDDAAVAACKSYLAARYKMIYADQLWKASLYTLTFTLPVSAPGDYEPNIESAGEAGMYFMPDVVDRVLGIRRAESEMSVVDEMELFRGSFDDYTDEDATGAVRFSILSPAVFWNPAPNITGQQLRLTAFDPADNTLEVVSKWTSDTDDARRTAAVATQHSFGGSEDRSFRLVESITHPPFAGDLMLEYDEAANGSWLIVGRSLAGSTGFVPRQRVRLYPKPGAGAAAVSYTALVKRKCLELDSDNAVPQLAGIENCLMAFAQADMLQRARQYGKAQLPAAEAVALLEQFKRVEVAQQADRMRITPQVTEVSGEMYDWGGKSNW